MARQYWFASLLSDAGGHWSGRLLRPVDVDRLAAAASDADHDADREVLPAWADAAAGSCGELLLPAGVLPSAAANNAWTPGQLQRRGRLTVLAQGQRTIYLDTAQVPTWSFAESATSSATASTAVTPDLADLGFLLNAPVAAGRAAGRCSPLPLIRLLVEIERDADTRQLEQAFRADPELSYLLLRMLNSAAFGGRTPVLGLGHAITLLGRRQLQRWLQLLIYAQSGGADDAPNPLLQLAAYRGHLLEDLARQADSAAELVDAAYMVGIFSLLDRLIAQPLADIVGQLPLPPAVAAALARGEGRLGQWLALAVAGERGELATAAAILDRLGISPAGWLSIQDAAYRWAYGLGVNAGQAPSAAAAR